MLDQLYKRTATGAVQIWNIETDIHRGRYRTISGQLDGKQVTSEWTQCKPKNVGRANATTASEQALLEAQAAWEKKQRDGYSLLIPEAEQAPFQCQLAKEYKDPLRKKAALAAAAKGQLFSQPKLDGVRLLASEGSMMSRKNRPIVAVPHIEEVLRPVFERFPGLVLDGELYSVALKDDFDSLVSIVRKTKPSAEDLERARVMEYWIYDCAGEYGQYELKDRLSVVQQAIGAAGAPDCLVWVNGQSVANEAAIDKLYEQYLAEGYEGQMLRINAPYEHKRSDKLLKRKEFADQEFVVHDIVEGEGNRTGQAGFVVLDHNPTFKAGIKAALEHRLELLKNKQRYIGGQVTVRFNGRTPSGVPRFPRAVAWFPDGKRDV